MSDTFVPFDQVRRLVSEVLEGMEIPADAPPLYLVRNLFGKVGISVSEAAQDDRELGEVLSRLASRLADALAAHGHLPQKTVLFVDPALLETLGDTAQLIRPGVHWADRLVVGQEWWTVPDPSSEHHPARYVLYSVKGGVGRSTTAAVLAWHLARQAEDVLVIDLDLESPGLASAMLEPPAEPEFGVTDWFVEELVGQGDHVVSRMTGKPSWAHDLPGRVLVAPAHGRKPGEYLAKLGRTYMDTAIDPWTSRLKRLVVNLETEFSPTVVLIESRSGLHDIAAATVTDLDAEVMLFAVDSDSHWTDYGILFDHWARTNMASRIRERLSIVSALTPETDTERYVERFRENARILLRDRLQDEIVDLGETDEGVSADLSSEEGQHDPLVIHWTRGFAAGISLRKLERTTVAQAYREFLRRFDLLYRSPEPVGDPTRAETVRLAFSELPDPASYGEPVPSSAVYIPPSHRKAMHPDTMLVTGMRGSGKTFWWRALQSPEVRRSLGREVRGFPLNEDSVVESGFGVSNVPGDYPVRDDLCRLIANNVEPRIIWRTVHACAVAGADHPIRQFDTWLERARYVLDDPSVVLDLLRTIDVELDSRGVYSVVLFDALDRAASDWQTASELIRGLLEHALDMRPYRRLRAKIFLRTDQVDERRITDFPDASKVLSSAVDLSWPRRDLYGLLWHSLANGPRGDLVRPRLQDGHWSTTDDDTAPRFEVPYPLDRDEGAQRDKFHEFAGPWMGTDRRRGYPYTWIPNHLADAGGKVSPRSFLTALRSAAEDSHERHPDHGYALHYQSIKHGVREASTTRVRELQEDYPWVQVLMQPLSGRVVPCDFEEVVHLWRERRVLKQLAQAGSGDGWRLPLPHMDYDHDELREALESLGIFRRLRDDRVDVPDVFRIGYGLRRKGGVRPAR
ncbi:KGGVGR-motif variant AAA ATPase [Candidatus Palauibacter sp.]|uniref:KGGVGR-motif variant AAA ATPase n=1 Tax=Candidatus Palauibacter sp. TaxID=3101350 RepID=UPI003B52C557